MHCVVCECYRYNCIACLCWCLAAVAGIPPLAGGAACTGSAGGSVAARQQPGLWRGGRHVPVRPGACAHMPQITTAAGRLHRRCIRIAASAVVVQGGWADPCGCPVGFMAVDSLEGAHMYGCMSARKAIEGALTCLLIAVRCILWSVQLTDFTFKGLLMQRRQHTWLGAAFLPAGCATSVTRHCSTPQTALYHC